MCFTVNVNIVKEELESRYGSELLDPEKYNPSYYYHAFAFPDLPVVYLNDKFEKEIRTMKWGLIPSWTDSEENALKIRKMTPNARSETLNSKPSFADSFERRRGLIPVAGFFEWQHLPSGKRPWYIYSPDRPVISLAAIFDTWHNPEAGSNQSNEEGKEAYLSSFSILTTAANRMMAEIHNSKKRMPVIVPEHLEGEWLEEGNSKQEIFFRPAKEDLLKAHTVNPALGRPGVQKNIPAIIEPYTFPEEPVLF